MSPNLLSTARAGRLVSLALVAACACAKKSSTRPPCAEHDPLKKAYFGDLHVHTTLSYDAWTYNVRTTPEQAYSFARGQPVMLPPLDASGNGTTLAQLDRPLDFAAITDHSEYLGETSLCTTPGSAAYNSQTCDEYRPPKGFYNAFGIGVPLGGRSLDLCGMTGLTCTTAATPIWQRLQQAAADNYDDAPRCEFTSFVAYEYTLTPLGSNMHRNVIFRNEQVLDAPVSFYEANTPADLWQQLKTQCIDGKPGCDALVIAHNSNLSNGNMFLPEYPGATTLADQASQAALRQTLEPLMEITQTKGDSECTNGLTTYPAAADELCNYEKTYLPPLTDCGLTGTGSGAFLGGGCTSENDFARGALKTGLTEEIRLGTNPFQLGFIGSTDSHNGTPGNVLERKWRGHGGDSDDTPAEELAPGTGPAPLRNNPGGLAGVWSEENSRDYLFDSLRNRETFGTSGPRIQVRFFGGWKYPQNLCSQADLVKQGYSGGVPMGGVLPKAPNSSTAPTFVVTAAADPGTAAAPGTPLQQAQIIKGWVDPNGVPQEQVFTVAGDPNNGASVDTTTCALSGSGFSTLCGTWTDPSFDPTLHAFYYARVVENPSCRWSTWVCNSLPPDQQAANNCANLGVPQTIQERAWASPIWYTP
jgi:hypothetical protein